MMGTAKSLSRLGQRWIAIAESLGLRVEAPASIVLPAGEQIDVDVLLCDFGAQRGMVLVTDDEVVWAHRASIVEAGYGFSVLSDPAPDGDYAFPLADTIDLLRDWGWSGKPQDEPVWMRDDEPVAP
jgi:hypothetical protein